MKKKYSLLIFGAIYLVSLTLGFSLAGFRQARVSTPTPAGSQQSNWIIVRVDDMTQEHPHLVSVWATFVTFTPGPQIFFKPIYTPEAASPSASKLPRLFAVNADRTISADFIQEVDHLNIQRSGMVIMDDSGFLAFTSWFTSSPAALKADSVIPATGRAQAIKIAPEIQAYYKICAALQEPNSPRSQGLAWHALVPNHILPHPDLKTLANLWEKIISSNAQANCEVIAN